MAESEPQLETGTKGRTLPLERVVPWFPQVHKLNQQIREDLARLRKTKTKRRRKHR